MEFLDVYMIISSNGTSGCLLGSFFLIGKIYKRVENTSEEFALYSLTSLALKPEAGIGRTR